MQRHVFAFIFTMLVGTQPSDVHAADGQEKAAMCAACHGADGNSINAEWPKLAGQHASYIRAQLAAYKSGTRKNPMMSPMAGNLSDAEVAAVADYFSTQKIQIGTARKELVESGQKLFRGGNAATGVPACMACHGPNGSGIPAAAYPALHGQHATYTANQLKTYRSGERSTDTNAMMRTVAKRMSDAEIEAVASYIEGLH